MVLNFFGFYKPALLQSSPISNGLSQYTPTSTLSVNTPQHLSYLWAAGVLGKATSRYQMSLRNRADSMPDTQLSAWKSWSCGILIPCWETERLQDSGAVSRLKAQRWSRINYRVPKFEGSELCSSLELAQTLPQTQIAEQQDCLILGNIKVSEVSLGNVLIFIVCCFGLFCFVWYFVIS